MRKMVFFICTLVGCTDVHVPADNVPDAGEIAEDAMSPSDDAGAMSPSADVVRCTLGVDCDKIAFDCSGCDDNNTCTEDVCEVDKVALTKTCSARPLTGGLCMDGVDVSESLDTACRAKNSPTQTYRVTVDFANGECFRLENPFTREHLTEVTQAFCCEEGGICGHQRVGRCTQVLQ
jgi:hypothetical protein